MLVVTPFYDKTTSTITYIVYDQTTKDALVIDPVLNYDPLTSQTSTTFAKQLIDFVKNHQLKVYWILETHAHADHLSASQYLQTQLNTPIGIGQKITLVQTTFQKLFDLPDTFQTDGSQFDKLIEDGELMTAGVLRIKAIATPGHTPACLSYQIQDALFTGDALFMHDYGTGRCDFPQGSADELYTSIHENIYILPEQTRIFVGHDYQPGGREPQWETTIGRSKQENPQLRQETSRKEFVQFRNQRDVQLSPPRLLYQSIQVNIDAGRLPQTHSNGIRYFRLPLNTLDPTDDFGNPLKQP